jgi:hypothetical protein
MVFSFGALRAPDLSDRRGGAMFDRKKSSEHLLLISPQELALASSFIIHPPLFILTSREHREKVLTISCADAPNSN